MTGHYLRTAAISLAALGAMAGAAVADVSTVRIAKQFGIPYLPLTVMQEEGLIDKHAAEAGIELTAEWLRFTGGSGMNEALLSGNLDIAAGGVGPMLTLWSRTQTNAGFRTVAALGSMPLFLVSVNPAVTTIEDLGDSDKIALPTVKTSIQAITLQMAAEQAFGEGEGQRLDALTVSMGHPDAQLAMMGGQSGITAHFASSPFQEMELKEPNARKVLDSYEVLGGPHTFSVAWASKAFVEDNPTVMKVFHAALADSMALIENDPGAAADIFMKSEATNLSRDEVIAIIDSDQTQWTTELQNVLPFLDHMYRVGLVRTTTSDMADLVFPQPAD